MARTPDTDCLSNGSLRNRSEVFVTVMSRIEHIGIVVTSYEEAREFYVNALGAEVVREGENGKLRFGFLAFENIYIELFELLDPRDKRARLGGDDVAGRLDHLAILTDHLATTATRARELGVRMTADEPFRYEPLGSLIFNTVPETSGGVHFQFVERDRPLAEYRS